MPHFSHSCERVGDATDYRVAGNSVSDNTSKCECAPRRLAEQQMYVVGHDHIAIDT